MFGYTMFLLKLHLFTLTSYGLIFDLDAVCPRGHRVVLRGRTEYCEECNSGSFQNEESHTQHCKPCTHCDEASGSFIEHSCTKTSNTICKCRKGFVAMDEDFSTCQCNAGFGKESKECTECKDGFFSKNIDSPCKKWKECKFGVNINGTRTSDVTCNEIAQADTSAVVSPTLGKVVSSNTVDQHVEHTLSSGLITTIATTTIMSPTRQITHLDTKVQPSFGFLITFVTVGLLVLAVMLIKLYLAFYKENNESVQKDESLYRRPVEEIGSASQVSLKLDPEEY